MRTTKDDVLEGLVAAWIPMLWSATLAIESRLSWPPTWLARLTDRLPDVEVSVTQPHSLAQVAAAQFAVFARPDQGQIARHGPAPSCEAGRPRAGPRSVLHRAIPSLTRYTQTLPDGREVFLAVYPNEGVMSPVLGRHVDRTPQTTAQPIPITLIIVQPDAKWTAGQPGLDPEMGERTADAYLAARSGRHCALDTYWGIVPDQVTRVRWQFGRQDPHGYVTKRRLPST